MTVRRTPLNQRQREVLWNKQLGLCGICREELDAGRFEDDHILALIDGGTNDIANRRLVHPRCHREKSSGEHSANCHVKRVKFGRTKSGREFPKRHDPWGKEWRAKQAAEEFYEPLEQSKRWIKDYDR